MPHVGSDSEIWSKVLSVAVAQRGSPSRLSVTPNRGSILGGTVIVVSIPDTWILSQPALLFGGMYVSNSTGMSHIIGQGSSQGLSVGLGLGLGQGFSLGVSQLSGLGGSSGSSSGSGSGSQLGQFSYTFLAPKGSLGQVTLGLFDSNYQNSPIKHENDCESRNPEPNTKISSVLPYVHVEGNIV